MKLEDITGAFNYDGPMLGSLKTIVAEDPEGVKRLDNCEIICEALEWDEADTQSLFVASTGVVFPCCFTASKYYATSSFETIQLRRFIERYGVETITLSDTKNIKDIVESGIMTNGYVNSWNKKSIKEGKLYTCGTFCGKDMNTEIKSTKDSIQYHKGISVDV